MIHDMQNCVKITKIVSDVKSLMYLVSGVKTQLVLSTILTLECLCANMKERDREILRARASYSRASVALTLH